MGKKDKKKRQKDMQRKLGQGGISEAAAIEAAQARLSHELGDPQRLAGHLNTFAQLALVWPVLHPLRFPARAFVEALLEAEVPDGDPDLQAKLLRAKVIPRFIEAETLPRLMTILEAAQEEAQHAQQLVPIMAARAVGTSAAQDAENTDHPFWSLIFDLSISEAVLSGHFLIRFVLSELKPDPAEVGATFAKALAGAELSRELDELGLDETNPAALAQRYLELVADEEPYHVQFDAVLHLAGLHVGLAETVGRVMTRSGPTAQVREMIRALYDKCYREDVTPQLAGELKTWFGKHLRRLQDPASLGATLTTEQLEREQRRALTAYLALSVFPPESSDFLRAVHVQSLVRARTLAGELEAPFVEKLWSQPSDTFSLEEYERFLRERGDVNRAKRVRGWIEAMKRNRQQVEQALGELAPKPGGA